MSDVREDARKILSDWEVVSIKPDDDESLEKTAQAMTDSAMYDAENRTSYREEILRLVRLVLTDG